MSRSANWSVRLLIILAVLVCLAAIARSAIYAIVREHAFDNVIAIAGKRPASAEPIVVDIDRASLDDTGPWPWRREQLARLLESLAEQHPRAVGIDILLAGPDEMSPAALARRLEASVDDPLLGRLAAMPDGDDRLRTALSGTKTVIGVALDPNKAAPSVPTPPILARGTVELFDIWQAPGLIAPIAKLTSAAAGLGLLALPGDADGNVRRIPLLAATRTQIVPGLVVELLRIAREASALVLSSPPRVLGIGDLAIPLEDDAMLRLMPSAPNDWPRRTIPASAVLNSPDAGKALTGRIVLVGSSAPEVGGLRPAHGGLLVPSVQLHADSLTQLQSGEIPRRPSILPDLELGAAEALALGGIALAFTLPPTAGVCLVVAAAAAWVAAAFLAYAHDKVLLDPLLGPLAVSLAYLGAALTAAAQARRRAAALRRRFEQHLAPAVVRRIVDNPDLLKLEGELRTVTALFTDVEGFTAMTERSEPHLLLRVLDRYFEGLSQIVVEHGGMVDKIIGDAICAIFNAPLDVPDHPRRAFECACAIARFAGEFQARPDPAALGFGRTRIGLETGPAIVGDVGGGRKLDYTANGTTINTAARLEGANKELSTTICLGPGIASLLPVEWLRPLGRFELRGRSTSQNVFSPWPECFSEADRYAYLAAAGRAVSDAAEAAERLHAIGSRLNDKATIAFAHRLRASLTKPASAIQEPGCPAGGTA